MIKEFSDDSLCLIRDVFAEMCISSIGKGNVFNAEEELEVINTVQSQLEEEEFPDLTAFYLDNNSTWNEIGERELEEDEEKAISVLVEWAKSEETDPTDSLKDAVCHYLKESHNYEGHDKEQTLRLRTKAVNGLAILCQRRCTEKEIDKLLAIVSKVVSDI